MSHESPLYASFEREKKESPLKIVIFKYLVFYVSWNISTTNNFYCFKNRCAIFQTTKLTL